MPAWATRRPLSRQTPTPRCRRRVEPHDHRSTRPGRRQSPAPQRGRPDRAGRTPVTTKLEGAEHDLLAYTAFPEAHWSKVWPNDPKEQLNRQLTRRTDVVQKFLNTESVICLVGALLIQVNDEMNSQSSAGSRRITHPTPTIRSNR